MSRLPGSALALLLVLVTNPVAAQHDQDILIGSNAPNGGALVADFDFNEKIVATPSVLPGFFTTTEPGFDAITSAGSGGFPLVNGTTVSIEITALDAGVQMQIDGATLDGPGDRAVIGAMPDLHLHPQWQLLLDEGATGDFTVTFRLTANGYANSAEYAATVSNVEGGSEPTPTPSALATPSPTSTPGGGGRICGDADGSGGITVTDGVNVLRAAAGLASTCNDPAPCDVNGNGAVTVTDGVNVLRAAAGLAAELQCFDLE